MNSVIPRLRRICTAMLVWLSLLATSNGCADPRSVVAPAAGIGPQRIAVIVNRSDEDSVALGRYYLNSRGIPAHNLIEVDFKPGRARMSEREFAAVKEDVDRQVPPEIQAFALTWLRPYRVGCMSVTSAFTFGFDAAWCGDGCVKTKTSPYYDSEVTQPWDELGIRPTMSIAAASLQAGRALIDRGVAADGTRPAGTGYLLRTSDRRRNVRAAHFPRTVELLSPLVKLQYLETEFLEDRDDVLFYFTGGKDIPAIDSNRYLPGAVADHLTSGGGKMPDGAQMSALRWLEAGATASYGAVVEPCNFPEKFPEPQKLIAHYVAGVTVIEAYWKSVAMPGQGIFIGEPLARPFANLARH